MNEKQYTREDVASFIFSLLKTANFSSIIYYIETFGREAEKLYSDKFRERKPRKRVTWTTDEVVIVLNYINNIVDNTPTIIKEYDLVANCRRVGITSENISNVMNQLLIENQSS